MRNGPGSCIIGILDGHIDGPSQGSGVEFGKGTYALEPEPVGNGEHGVMPGCQAMKIACIGGVIAMPADKGAAEDEDHAGPCGVAGGACFAIYIQAEPDGILDSVDV